MFGEFVKYCLDFYGKGGIYDMGATEEQVFDAIDMTIVRFGADSFEGDSVDRERIRDAMIERFGLIWPSN